MYNCNGTKIVRERVGESVKEGKRKKELEKERENEMRPEKEIL